MIIVLEVSGDRAKAIIEAARDWLQKHWPTLVAVLALVAGVFVTLLGVTGLASGQHNTVGRLSRGSGARSTTEPARRRSGARAE